MSWVLWLSILLVSAAAPCRADSTTPLLDFNIPASSLDQALSIFGGATQEQLLIDASVMDGRRSNAVKGKLTVEAALRQMLAGSGLGVRAIDGQGFTIVRLSPADVGIASGISISTMVQRYSPYSAMVQSAVGRVLCGAAETTPGDYRTMARIWIGAAGMVARAELLMSSGNSNRDTMLLSRLGGLAIGAPPLGLPQPVTVLVTSEGIDPQYCAAINGVGSPQAGRGAPR